ncbi:MULTISPECIES: flagellar export chaperone FliS [Anoxybacillus]|uniref:Flagellar secretion chaperone FliS n=2 Tax=Anoxybacillus TaxID=150247 RepID=A0A0D0HM70_9BACL|nr:MULTISPECIES: flagellar export chaperone FliS [Anoxybacillus]EPZ37582.1 flagellin-specific chaperone FliS [Anoxybacillus ayderensis]KIP21264.1 Flagellar protein fliS [Anoxybacillus ayderensis]NNU96376.1 flagellar export chaperone FliS [Anoxybacillus sp. EFIL]CUA80566.1 flagellar biosynthetic protein FliS [Anoxybacillus suryakundensis]
MEFLTEEAVYKKTPQQLTALLYEGLIESVEEAIASTKKGDYSYANKLLQKANDILQRLGVGLNYDAGIIAHQLDALYNYMAERLIDANMKKDVAMMQEVLTIAKDIATAWNEALKKQPTTNVVAKKAATYEQFIMTE